MKIELLSSSSGDWVVLKVNDEVYYEGHTVPNRIWLKLLAETGAETSSSEVDFDE